MTPLAGLPGLPWPNLPTPRPSIWQPVPVGINEDGELVTVGLIERNVLIGGEPGGGKSVGQSMLLDRYGHLFPEADTALRARLDELFRAVTEHRRNTASLETGTAPWA